MKAINEYKNTLRDKVTLLMLDKSVLEYSKLQRLSFNENQKHYHVLHPYNGFINFYFYHSISCLVLMSNGKILEFEGAYGRLQRNLCQHFLFILYFYISRGENRFLSAIVIYSSFPSFCSSSIFVFPLSVAGGVRLHSEFFAWIGRLLKKSICNQVCWLRNCA